jgi:hypothetical protein
MILIRWFLTAVFAAVALTVDVGNAIAPIVARKRGRNVSAVPLLGALSGLVACLACPAAGSGKLIPVAVLLDLSVYHLAKLVLLIAAGRGPKPE